MSVRRSKPRALQVSAPVSIEVLPSDCVVGAMWTW
jgi:hypothetical protein